MATQSSGLAWRIPMDRGAWWATFHGLKESDMTERLSTGLFFKKRIYLAVLSLSCGMQDLLSQCTDSLVVVGVFRSCGTQAPECGLQQLPPVCELSGSTACGIIVL